MKIIVVILVLIQISLIVPNPNNIESEQKESKGIGRNLNHQRRLGIFDGLWKKISNVAQDIAGGVKKAGKKVAEVAKNAGEKVTEVAKKTWEKIADTAKTAVHSLKIGAKLIGVEVNLVKEKLLEWGKENLVQNTTLEEKDTYKKKNNDF